MRGTMRSDSYSTKTKLVVPEKTESNKCTVSEPLKSIMDLCVVHLQKDSIVARCSPKNKTRLPYQAARLTLRTISGFELS